MVFHVLDSDERNPLPRHGPLSPDIEGSEELFAGLGLSQGISSGDAGIHRLDALRM